MTKFRAFAEDKLNIAIMKISLYDRVEKSVRKGENAGYQHFLFFPVFSKTFFKWVLNSGLCEIELTLSQTSPCLYVSASLL